MKLQEARAGAILAAVAMLITQAQADDRDTCLKQSGDVAIAACTQAIASGRYGSDDLAKLYHNRGGEYQSKQQYDLAIADYNTAIRLSPRYQGPYIDRGVTYRAMHQNDRAIASYNEVLRINPNNSFALNNRGLIYKEMGQYDRAIQDFNQALRVDPKDFSPQRNRADVYLITGQYDRAIADYNATALLRSGAGDALYGRGIARLKKGDTAAGAADIAAAKVLEADIVEQFGRRGILPPNNFNSPNWCGGKDGATPDLQISGCTSVIQSGRLSGINLSIPFFNRANGYRNKGEYDHAIEDYSESIRLDPKDASPFINRGIVFSNKGQYDRAIEDYNEAIKLRPKSFLAFNNRGSAYKDKGQYARAIEDYNEAIRLLPKYWLAYRNRADVYLTVGQYDRAIEDYDIIERLDPKSADGLYGRGLAKLKKGDTEGGNADMTAAKAIDTKIAEQFAKRSLESGVVGTSPPMAPANTTTVADCAQAEAHWKSAETINILAVYEDHLAKFPNCAFTALAKAKIEALKK